MVLLDLGKVLVLRPTSSQSVAPVKRRIPLGISYKQNIHYCLTLISQDFSLHLWLLIIKLHVVRIGKPFMQIFTGNSACNNHHLTLFKAVGQVKEIKSTYRFGLFGIGGTIATIFSIGWSFVLRHIL